MILLAMDSATPESGLNTAAHSCDDPFCMEQPPALRWVALYRVRQVWGGPEEGGWWYDQGDLILERDYYPVPGIIPQCFEHHCEALAAQTRMDTVAGQLNAGRRSYQSQYRAEIHCDTLPDFYPAELPRWE